MRETNLPDKWHRILIIEFNCFWMSRPESQAWQIDLNDLPYQEFAENGCLVPDTNGMTLPWEHYQPKESEAVRNRVKKNIEK